MVHVTVLRDETISWLGVRKGGRYIDGTLGGGGHAEAILEAAGGEAMVLGIDRDGAAIGRCRERLRRFGGNFVAVQANFAGMAEVAAGCGFSDVDGVVLDLGVSSFQLDDPARGFGFSHDGPLDMRMDASHGETAAGLLQGMKDDWRRLAGIFRDYGEEPRAGQIARAVCAALRDGPVSTTGQLAGIVERAVGGRRGSPRHPATRVFQALRIAVNGELDAAKAGIEAGLRLLAPGGRMAVISFHSLEDRIVKRCFAAHAGRMVSLQQGGAEWQGEEPKVALPARKPIVAGEAELAGNPRARSAKLRVAERAEG